MSEFCQKVERAGEQVAVRLKLARPAMLLVVFVGPAAQDSVGAASTALGGPPRCPNDKREQAEFITPT